MLRPWHEKLTNTQPSDIGVGDGSSAVVGAPGVDVGIGVGDDIAGTGVGTDAGVVSCPDPSSGINRGSGVDTGTSAGDGLGAVVVVVTVFCAKT